MRKDARKAVVESSARAGCGAALQWPLHCDISPTAFFLHIYFDVAWVGQSPGKWLLGNPRTIIARIDWPRLS